MSEKTPVDGAAPKPRYSQNLYIRQRRIVGSERREKIMAAVKQGFTYEAIGKQLGITKQAVAHQINVALAERAKLTALDTDAYVQLELERVDAQMAALWPNRADPRVCDSIMRLSERRDKLNGFIGPPIKVDATIDNGQSTHTPEEAAAKVELILSNALARIEAKKRHEALKQMDEPPQLPPARAEDEDDGAP